MPPTATSRIRVSGGRLQRALGLADVEVQAAGGGGDKHNRRGHTGRFDGLSNADAIRDLLVERVRAYRDSGLGEMTHHQADGESAADIRAAKQVLEEARTRRASLLRRLAEPCHGAGTEWARSEMPPYTNQR